MTAPRLADLADRLSERYDTRVKVDLGKSKGKITVEFATIDDLERIVTLMDPAKRETPKRTAPIHRRFRDSSICRQNDRSLNRHERAHLSVPPTTKGPTP